MTLNLTQPISLKSALNLVLSPLGLSYVIQNEVLRITSEQTRDSNVYAKAYYVADLVMPIPNFVPNYNLGLPGAIRESINAMTGLGIMPRSPSGVLPLTIAKDEGKQQGSQTSAEVLAQINNFGRHAAACGGMGACAACEMPSRLGPGGMGGGAQARLRQPDRTDHQHDRPPKLGTKSAARAPSPATRTTSASSSARRRKSTSRLPTCWSSSAACRTCK